MVEPEGESRTSIDIDSSVLLDPPTPVNEVEIVIDEKCSVLHHQESYTAIKDKWREIIGSEAEIVVCKTRLILVHSIKAVFKFIDHVEPSRTAS